MPPEWLTGWLQFLLVQLVGLITLGIGIWKWLTKPLREESRKNFKRIVRIKRIFKEESFNLRTEVTSMMRETLENKSRMDQVEYRLDDIQVSSHKIQETLDLGLREIRDRLTKVETELNIRFENDKYQNKGIKREK